MFKRGLTDKHNPKQEKKRITFVEEIVLFLRLMMHTHTHTETDDKKYFVHFKADRLKQHFYVISASYNQLTIPNAVFMAYLVCVWLMWGTAVWQCRLDITFAKSVSIVCQLHNHSTFIHINRNVCTSWVKCDMHSINSHSRQIAKLCKLCNIFRNNNNNKIFRPNPEE